ncbi:MAG TPA: dipeptidase [Bacteroidales bacterium]|nr:dipeptidase [Bacteroidales bacterium]
MRRLFFLTILAVFAVLSSFNHVAACTNVLVSRGASADGSVMISWTYDVTGFMAPLQFYPGGEYAEGDSLDIFSFREHKFLGRIKQVPKTYKVVGNMNENQVAIGETTFTGRKELHGGDGLLDYGNLIYITLQRARTAREAILIMDELASTYGYHDTGESFSIGDKDEAWVVEFIGKGEYGRGALWVAARVPDGYIAAHANQARIRKVNWNDTENWMWPKDLVDFAREKGWFEGPDSEFSFVDVYDPVTPTSLLLCESRVWSVFRRAAPSQDFPADYWRCVKGAEPYPLFVKPDKKLSVRDVINFHRDHFHETPYYTGTGIASGPYDNPYRWRPVFFRLDDDTTRYGWERPISQPQTAFSFISQARNWLPGKIGGICWYSVDDTYSNAWMPMYLGLTQTPPSLAGGSPIEFDWDKAYWVFSLVNNFAYGIYNQVMPDIQKVQKEIEDRAFTMVPAIDQAALALHDTNPELLGDFLTNFSVNNAEYTTERWRQLGHYLFVKYNDRYRRPEMRIDSWPEGIGYPDDFNRRAVEERPGYYDVRWREPGEKIE